MYKGQIEDCPLKGNQDYVGESHQLHLGAPGNVIISLSEKHAGELQRMNGLAVNIEGAVFFQNPGDKDGQRARQEVAGAGYWLPAIVTDKKGKASVEVPMPESTTQWRLIARGCTVQTLVGEAKANVITRKDFFVNIKAPKAFQEGDSAGILARVHNLTDYEGPVDLTLKIYSGEDFQDMLAGLDHLVETGIADPERLGICGWSYGGFTAAWAVTQTDRFKAAIMGAGIADWRAFHGRSYLHVWDAIHYDDSDPYDLDSAHAAFSPINFVKNVQTPTLILHGEQDWDVPVEQGYQFFRALKDQGVDTRLVVYPREPHGVEEYGHQLDIAKRVRQATRSNVVPGIGAARTTGAALHGITLFHAQHHGGVIAMQTHAKV